jgi:hypothetical protein
LTTPLGNSRLDWPRLTGLTPLIDFLDSIGIDSSTVLIVIALSTILFTLLYKKFVFSIFDPLCLFILSMIANSAIMFSLPWSSELKWEYGAYAFALWIGFSLSSGSRPPKTCQTLRFSESSLFDLRVVLLLLFVVIVAGNLYLGASTGFPLLSLHPSESKVTTFTGGLGLVRRLNTGPYVFFCCGCVYLAAIQHRRRFAITLLFISTGFIMLSGSKGALLTLIFAQAYVFAHPGLKKSPTLVSRVKKYTLLTLVAAVAVALAVTIRDTGSVGGGVLALFKRILLTGDVILYYFAGRTHIMALTDQTLVGYLKYLFNDTLGMLRAGDYQQTLGSVILGGDDGFGPNAQYFVRADLFFGPVYGCVYSFVIGYCIGSLRTNFFSISKASPMTFTLRLALAACAFTLATESSMFVSETIAISISVFPLWILAFLIRIGSTAARRDRQLRIAASGAIQ